MRLLSLNHCSYRDAWAIQEQVHAEVLGGAEETLLLVEHPPVITLGRRGETEGAKHLIASEATLKEMGVELVQSDRGGDITFHGPGQIVAYPIVRLNAHGLSVGAYVRRLEQVVMDTVAEFGVTARRVEKCVGVWAEAGGEGGGRRVEDRATDSALCLHPSALSLEKLCAIGVRVKRGITLHGIALNVETDLRYFDLIVPCGLQGKRATSLRKLLGDRAPEIAAVRDALVRKFRDAFTPSPSGRGQG